MWNDICPAVEAGAPCFAGTYSLRYQRLYDELEDEHQLKLYCNHCYVVCAAYVEGDERYFRSAVACLACERIR